MAVYNGGSFLRTAIDSILVQSYADFEFLVVDDASIDDTPEIVRSYCDPRIRLQVLPRNVGQTAALNAGLESIRSPWIARMDADDFSARVRFEEQMTIAKADPRIGCVGTCAWFFRNDPSIRDATLTLPTAHEDIIKKLLWSSPLIHSTLLIRTNDLRKVGGYDLRYRYSADLELYDRLTTFTRATNIGKPLHGLRRHLQQDSYSLKAIRETVELLGNRLDSERYTRNQRATIRASKHLHEALGAMSERRYASFAAHVACSFATSPSLTVKHIVERVQR